MWNFIKTFYQDICFLLSILLISLCMGGCGLIKEPPTTRLMRASHIPGVDVQCFMTWESRHHNSGRGVMEYSNTAYSQCWGTRIEPNLLRLPLWTSSFNIQKDWPDYTMCIEREHATTGRVIWRGAPYMVPVRTDSKYAYYKLN
jgi:hypothetical protein